MTNTNLTIHNALSPLIGLAFIFVFFSLLNMPVLATIWENSFDDGTYSHAYLIPFITLFLYYKLALTGRLLYRKKLTIGPIALLCLSAVFFFIMATAQISLGYWAGMMAVILASILLTYRANWSIIFPALFLIFLIPGWGLLTPLLQKLSVSSVTLLMSFSGIPTFVDGNFVTIPAGVFEIADGCSGLRYLIVSLSISSLFVFLYIKNTKKAVMFFSMAILGALLTNWIRITALILIGEYTNMQSDLMTDHNTFGWYLYVPFLVLLFMWGNKLADSDRLSPAQTPNNSGKPVSLSYPAILQTLIVIFAIILSSTSLKAIITPSKNVTTEVLGIKPIINDYTRVDIMQSPNSVNNTKLYLTYFFNGALTSGKPTAHNNNYIPTGWYQTSHKQDALWKYIVITNGRKKALIRYNFEINKNRTPSIRAFKKLRLIAALTGDRATYLHWQFITCANYCEQEQSTFE